MPKISVIITTHNRPELLPRAIESVRLSGLDSEIVVVDDASVDETSEVCRRIPDIRYVRVERNQRVAGARNLGIMASKGEYLSFLDDDDVRLAQSLDRQVLALESAPEAGLVYGQAHIGDHNCVPQGDLYPTAPCPHGDIFWQLLERNFIPCMSVVFRRSCLYRLGLLDHAAPGVDDWDLWIRIAEMYPVMVVEEPVAVWRKSTPTSSQGSSDPLDLIARSSDLLHHKWLALPRAANSPDQRRHAARQFSNNSSEYLLWVAAHAIVTRRFDEAKKALTLLLRQDPSSIAEMTWKLSHASTLKHLLNSALALNEKPVMKARFKKLGLADKEEYDA